jgi:PAS domain S-box-containing protein
VNHPTTSDLLGRLDAVVFEADAKTLRVTFAAGGALARLGFSSSDCTGDAQFLVKRLHPEDREQFLALLRAVASDGTERQSEHRMVSADGQERWFRTEFHVVPPAFQVLGLMIDVTEARHTAQALRRAEAQLRQVVNNTPVVMFALDRNGIVTLSEGSGLRALGLAPGQIVGRNVFELYPAETGIHALTRRALAGEEMTSTEETLGTLWETRWTPLFDDAGQPAGVTAVSIDLTARKRAEDVSAQAASLLRATLEATTDGVLVVDNDGVIVDYNRRFAEMWNIPDEILALRADGPVIAFVADQLRDPEGFATKVRSISAEPETVHHDFVEFRDGRIYERDARPQIVGGKCVGRVLSFRDVTAERRATRRDAFLAAASKILAGPLEDVTPLDVLTRMTVPWFCQWCNILLIDDDGEVRSAAAYHQDETKIELLRRLRPDMRQRDLTVAHVIDSGEPESENNITDEQLSRPLAAPGLSMASRDKIGILRTLGLRARLSVPLRARGQIIGVMVFATADAQRHFDADDVTLAVDLAQRAGLAIDNQRLYQSSKKAVALRDEFLSVASHELRTPVSSMQLAVQSALAVGSEAPPGFLHHSLESAERQTRRLGRLVDALLDVSRIQAGRLELQCEPTDLATIVREVAGMLAEDARRAGCDVVIEAEEGVAGNWDRMRLEQVVTNLVSNAIKYGAGAPIRLSVQRCELRARLAVRDQGIGVAPAERGRIFERFERAVSAKHYGGLGLGLYIVRRIVDAHAGEIAVESAPGAGAQFVVELPLSKPQ